MSYSEFIGKPWRKNGRGPEAYDCWGICMDFCKVRGIFLPELGTDHSKLVDMFENAESKISWFKELDKPESYCIAAFQLVGDTVSHAAIVLPGCRSMIHCMRDKKVCIELLRNWTPWLSGYYVYEGD